MYASGEDGVVGGIGDSSLMTEKEARTCLRLGKSEIKMGRKFLSREEAEKTLPENMCAVAIQYDGVIEIFSHGPLRAGDDRIRTHLAGAKEQHPNCLAIVLNGRLN